MEENDDLEFTIGTDKGFIFPARFYVVIVLGILFIILLSTNGWTMPLFYLSYVIVFFIFFNIIPFEETYISTVANEYISNPKPTIQYNCEDHKNNALDNIDKYLKCKQKSKPKVLCPKEFVNTTEIKKFATQQKELIQDDKFLKEKEPSGNAKRVCGLIPGHTFKGVKAPKEKEMSDEQLAKLMKLDIELHKAQIKLKNQLTEDPLDIDAKNNLKLVEDKISTTKPIIIYQLRKNKKTPEFIINATK